MVGGVVLSPREYQCLEWSARGKSAGEIGTILGIAERNARFHLDNARAKLGVRSLRQAIVLLTAGRALQEVSSTWQMRSCINVSGL